MELVFKFMRDEEKLLKLVSYFYGFTGNIFVWYHYTLYIIH